MNASRRLWLVLLCIFYQLTAVAQQTNPLFLKVPSTETGISFNNKLPETPDLNIITYEYFYNGGGVAAGDFNNDGLVDLFYTSNIQPNRLYLNKGNWKFEDITRSSGAGGRRGWKTGTTIADVNGDGYLDIYVCYSGDLDSTMRANQLLIINKWSIPMLAIDYMKTKMENLLMYLETLVSYLTL